MVFDAAAKTQGMSLNDMLITGPDLYNSLIGILWKFRQYKVAFSGDVPSGEDKERRSTRTEIFWKENKQNKTSTYAMQVMIFEAVSSPYCAQYVKNRNAMDFQVDYPKAVDAILHKHYMDDYLESVETEEEAIELANDVIMIHEAEGFELRSWKEKMMWLNDSKTADDSDVDSVSSGEEVPIWVRGEQRWVSGISEETTCQDVIQVLLQDEQMRGRAVNSLEKYQISERWRGVEQPLDESSKILDIWNAWGSAQTEVKISLRRVKHELHRPPSRRARCKSDSSTWSDRSVWKTIHPKRLHTLQNEKQPSSTEELLKLVLAQGEVIRRQLKKLRHSEHQIGYLEDKTHRARVRKHGSNYLLETYLRGLSEAVDPENDNSLAVDKNSDSGVITEADSEQSNTNNNTKSTRTAGVSFDRFLPSPEEFSKDIKDDDTSSTISESTIKEQRDLFEKIAKLNKRLLKEEEALVRLDANLKKYDKDKATNEEVSKALLKLRTDMTKSSCEMQHNEIVLEETIEKLENRRLYLENLHRDLANEDQEYEMLQALLFSKAQQKLEVNKRHRSQFYHTKELLDTLV